MSEATSKNFKKYELQAHAASLLPEFGITSCMRRIHGNAGSVDAFYNAENNAAFYGGVQTCGSVWVCPCCGVKIAARRKVELSQGIAAHEAMGGVVAMVTLTMRHHKGESLTTLLDGLKGAYRRLKSGRSFQTFKADVGLVGSVTSLEVTHGANGWHPHMHILLFLPNSEELETVDAWFTERWSDCLEAFGRSCNEHGVSTDYMDSKKILDTYLLKDCYWGLSSEVVASHSKDASGGSRTPMQLLQDSAGGDEAAGRLFQEYAIATKGRNKLVWSRGLRGLLLGDDTEKSDEELAEEEGEEEAVKVVNLTVEQWSKVVYLGLRGTLLDVIVSARGDPDAVRGWLVGEGVLRAWESSG